MGAPQDTDQHATCLVGSTGLTQHKVGQAGIEIDFVPGSGDKVDKARFNANEAARVMAARWEDPSLDQHDDESGPLRTSHLSVTQLLIMVLSHGEAFKSDLPAPVPQELEVTVWGLSSGHKAKEERPKKPKRIKKPLPPASHAWAANFAPAVPPPLNHLMPGNMGTLSHSINQHGALDQGLLKGLTCSMLESMWAACHFFCQAALHVRLGKFGTQNTFVQG